MENKVELNIYQKILILQEKIRVKKDKRNEFANFSYRSISDIFNELKPLLKDLGLVISFGGGKLDGDKYTLGFEIIDVNNPKNKIDETGEIYIDRTKAKMDLSQKCLSAKTFLKKSLLEDFLLINEDEDPDSHDNRHNETIDGMKKENEKLTKKITELSANFKKLKEKYVELEAENKKPSTPTPAPKPTPNPPKPQPVPAPVPSYSPNLTKIAQLAELAGLSADDLIKFIKAKFTKSELLSLTKGEETEMIDYLEIKVLAKKANVSTEELNNYCKSFFQKLNYFHLTADEKIKCKKDLERMVAK